MRSPHHFRLAFGIKSDILKRGLDNIFSSLRKVVKSRTDKDFI